MGRDIYSTDSTYNSELNTLLSDLISNTKIDYGFYNGSYGQNSDKVSAIGLCRGDIKPDACRRCLHNATIFLLQHCPSNKEAWGGYDECMLRYSNRQILHFNDYNHSVYSWNPMNTAAPWDQYEPVLRQLLEGLKSKAASGDSLRKFAAGNNKGPNFQTIYAVTQCTPDLSKQDCEDCLSRAIGEISNCCLNRNGGRVIKPSCNLRYDKDRFYDAGSPPSPPPAVTPASPPPAVTPASPSPAVTPSSPSPAVAPASPPQPLSRPSSTNTTFPQEKGERSRIVISTVVSVAAFVVLFTVIYCRFRKKRKTTENEAEADEDIQLPESLQFDLDTIKAATNDFSDENKLGQGGFGVVYKGRLYNGQEVAVKRLSKNSSQGDIEFKNELLLVAKLQHRNLVKLIGFCLERKERLLVYEFVKNKSLDLFIFDPIKRAHMNWQIRYKIIRGIARGLLYLHHDSQLRIIHRDLKASNILLDEEMNPKISDFGIARLVSIDQTQYNTNKIVGTYGYMAPEYAFQGHFSVRSDVYSFGILILEIVSGHKNSIIHHGESEEYQQSSLPSLKAWKNWKEGKASNIMDPTLSDGSINEIMRCIHISLLCVQENAVERPTMASVLLMLDSNSVTLPLPSQPAFLMNDGFSNIQVVEQNSAQRRSSQSVDASVNEASITEFYPR